MAAVAAGVLLTASGIASAQVAVPGNSSWALNGGTLDLGGASLQIAGAFSVAAGSVQNATNVALSTGGVLDAGSGSITLSGDWSNLGNFIAGSSRVNFVDGMLAQSSVTGNTTFSSLSFVSNIGKAYALQSGSTQTIESLLQILGTAAAGIQIQSTSPFASINLLNGGSQNIAFVGVSNVHATGQYLAPTLTNDGGSGNATGWFVQATGTGGGNGGAPGGVTPTPALSSWALLLLILGMIAGTLKFRHRFSPLIAASEN